MHNRRPRPFRRRSNGRDFRRKSHDNEHKRLSADPYLNVRGRDNFKPHQSAEKLLERYKILAKEALSSGDKILSENYLQHADHFERIVSYKNSNRNENITQTANITKEQNNNLSNSSEIDKDHITKNKE